ncbi:MAG: hypothetical protein ACK2UP_04865 [Candidatus Promineifilaceae bacterium]
MNDQEQQNQDWLLKKGIIVEQPFESTVPLFGPLIARLRSSWNNVAAKWYVRPMLAQQNEYNRLLVERVQDFEAYTYELTAEQDRDLSRLRHDLAALHLELRRLNQHLDDLGAQLGEISSDQESSGDGESV